MVVVLVEEMLKVLHVAFLTGDGSVLFFLN